jgi:hypothetical protein
VSERRMPPEASMSAGWKSSEEVNRARTRVFLDTTHRMLAKLDEMDRSVKKRHGQLPGEADSAEASTAELANQVIGYKQATTELRAWLARQDLGG